MYEQVSANFKVHCLHGKVETREEKEVASSMVGFFQFVKRRQ